MHYTKPENGEIFFSFLIFIPHKIPRGENTAITTFYIQNCFQGLSIKTWGQMQKLAWVVCVHQRGHINHTLYSSAQFQQGIAIAIELS